MSNGFSFQKVGLSGHIQNMPISSDFSTMQPLAMDSVGETKAGFKDVMSGLANNLNQEMNAPEKMMKSVMAGDNSVDIHDVMTAMAKAEISVNVATQITSKVIQAYDKIMQISV